MTTQQAVEKTKDRIRPIMGNLCAELRDFYHREKYDVDVQKEMRNAVDKLSSLIDEEKGEVLDKVQSKMFEEDNYNWLKTNTDDAIKSIIDDVRKALVTNLEEK